MKEVTGTQRSSYIDLLLVAFQGVPEQATSQIAASIREATARAEGLGVQIGDRRPPSSTSGSGITTTH